MNKQQENNAIITIDLSQWITQIDAANKKGCKPQYISELIRLGKVKSWRIEKLGLHLVDKQYFD